MSQPPPPASPHQSDFPSVWSTASAIPGWLTEAQARLLYDAASELGPGTTIVEIGSHQGRSTVVLATVAQQKDSTVVAVDPFVEGRLFGGLSTRDRFLANLREHRVEDTVELVQDYSTALRPTWTQRCDLLYIDGKHDYWTLSDDLRWSELLPPHAKVLIHDCFSSIGVTLGILVHVLPGRGLTYLHREGSMAVFERSRPGWSDRMRIVAELPWWLRNVGLKILLRLRLRDVARRLGHDSPYDPY